ncbi:unnamed protein product [Parascedosporium putredinis]|uniref:RRM domain-containing protein n=1 Tax=Parascedosporium putredinis TaxID=1442378 RepID=A0A9P1M6I9_9PEZI|nr:unnamed protein product [Parascedosporium putredinis]CAI7988478.1 unnamed protein product [Parascedosporium putredinis]
MVSESGTRSRGRRGSRTPIRSRSYSRDQSWSRSRSRSRDRGDGIKSTKIVVERLTKNVTEDHLREIFGQFGPIDDLDLPMNRQFNSNRGTAYILYVDELDAETAVANMHEGQIDGAIINVSIVLPRRKISPHPDGPPWCQHQPLLPPPGRRPSANGDNGPQNTRGKGGLLPVSFQVQIPTPAP